MKTATEPLAGTRLEAGDSGPARRTQRLSRPAKAVLSVIISTFLLAFFIRLPGHSACLGHGFLRTKPQSIEERVKSILTHTPLIGTEAFHLDI